jgi:hypothetical protein
VALEERLAVIISGRDDGASSAFAKVGTSADDAAKKTAASAEAVAVAQSKSRLAGIGAQRAAVDLAAAQRNLAAVTARSSSTDEQKKRATLAVQTAEVKHADAARAAGRAEVEASRAAKLHATALDEVKTGASASGTALKTALAAGAVAAGYAIVQFGKKAVAAASDLAESTGKAQVVFGDSADSVLKFGDTAAKSLGQSKQQAIEATGTFGNLFVAMGIGQKPAADLSISIVKLASDLASFNNSSPEEALVALRSGLIGETEPLRAFGVNLSAVAIQSEAVRLGLAKTPASASAAAKAQAAYSLILQQTKTAQGDFARTSSGAANQQRILAAQTADLAATSGKLLLPALITVERAAISVARPLGSLASSVAGLPPEAKAAGVSLLGTAAAVKTLQVVVPPTISGVKGMVEVVKNLKPGAIAAGGALAVLAAGAGVLVQKLDESKAKAGAFLDTLVQTSGVTDTAGQIRVYAQAIDAVGTSTKLSNEEQFQAALRLKGLAEQYQNEQKAAKIAAEQTAKNTTATDLMSQSLGKQDKATAASATHMNFWGEKVSNATGKVVKQKSAIELLTSALDTLNKKNIDAAEASIDFRDSLDSLKGAVKENGKSLDETTPKGRAVRTAFIDAAKAAQDLGAKVGDQKGYEAGRQSLIKSRDALIVFAHHLGLSDGAVKLLISQIYKIPPVKRSEIDLRIAAALKNAARIQGAISQVKGKTVTVQVNQSGNLQTITRDLQKIAGYGTIPVNIKVNGREIGRSKGGEVTGGIPGQDSVPALLMPGEYVETVAERRANRLRLGAGPSVGSVSAGSGTMRLAAEDRQLLAAAVTAAGQPVRVVGELRLRGSELRAVLDRVDVDRARR